LRQFLIDWLLMFTEGYKAVHSKVNWAMNDYASEKDRLTD